MSRIGKNPVNLPAKVKVNIDGSTVSVEGPKGKLSRNFDRVVDIRLDGETVVVAPKDKSRFARAMWGTARSIIQGMVIGVVEPYKKSLEIQGVGFRADLKGRVLNLALGYSHPINYALPEGVTVDVDKTGTKLEVSGCDKHRVGQVAADLKSYYPAEPYKGKGVRIVGEFVRRKEGKKTK